MNNALLVDERQRQLGEFLVGRLLPFRQKRQVGPFTFIDHMGPAVLDGKYMDVDQHPHIGLSTLTYLLEGEVEHRDSTGAHQRIGAGDVGFMTLGAGVTHTERTPEDRRNGPFRIHGYQVWVALPAHEEERTPHFQFIEAGQLPEKHHGGLHVKMVAGSGFGMTSPLEVYSPLFMADVRATEDATLFVAGEVQGEVAFVVTEGDINVEGEAVGVGQMLISLASETCTVKLKAGTRLLLFGGEPFPEPRHMRWNFVSSSKERLDAATALWEAKGFPKVPGDDTYIPMPQPKLK